MAEKYRGGERLVMSRTEHLLSLAPVMQAYLAGKTIQCRPPGDRGCWVDMSTEPSWSIDTKYRITPKLIEGYVNVYENVVGGGFFSTIQEAAYIASINNMGNMR